MCFLAFCLCPSLASLPSVAQAQNRTSIRTNDSGKALRATLKQAREAFKAENYDLAITLYQKYLAKRKKRYDVWAQLAAAYFHTGLADKCLSIMKRYRKRIRIRSYRDYYVGLAHKFLGNDDLASKAFTQASRARDPYGERALFELGLLAYHRRDLDRAEDVFINYARNYPRGRYSREVLKLSRSIEFGRYLKDIRGVLPKNPELAVYKYNSLSLSPEPPHYWAIELGGLLSLRTAQDATNEGLKSRSDVNQGLVVDGAIGLGPIRNGKTVSTAGYRYQQRWLSTTDRIDTFLADPTDIELQPFQTDLLQRTHSLHGDVTYKPVDVFGLGLYTRLEFVRIGSAVSLQSEEVDPVPLDEALSIRSTSLFVPWVGLFYADNFFTKAYLYFRKEINDDSTALSNKTFELIDEPFTLSFGFTQGLGFPEVNTFASLDLFVYEFIYNDFLEDYQRIGGLARIETEFVPSLIVDLSAGYYQDTYFEDTVRSSGCQTVIVDRQNQGAPQNPSRCPRDDTGWMLEFRLHWDYSDHGRVSFLYNFVQNSNAQLAEFESTKQDIRLTWQMAFPAPSSVQSIVEKYKLAAFAKQGE